MGDADEGNSPLKDPDDDMSTPVHIDVVNLASQMISMEILPVIDTPPARRAKKRVRFSLPESEPEDEPERKKDTVTNYRSKETGEFIKAKRRIPKMYICKVSEVEYENCGEPVNDTTVEVKNEQLIADEAPKRKYARKKKFGESADVNFNCASKRKGSSCKSDIVRTNHVRCKSKSDECISKQQNRKGKKKVLSKKKSVKDCGRYNRYVIGDKRKVADILMEFKANRIKEAKKRKMSHGNVSKKTNSNKNTSMQYCRSKSKLNIRSYRAKLASVKAKRAQAKLKRAKEVKRKSLLKKANEYRMKALKRKEQLKRKLAQKRKASKKLSKITTARKAARSRGWRKVRIIPTEREEEISECLRINLLKFLTFEMAFSEKHECCKRYCWDKWEELDIDDVLAHFD